MKARFCLSLATAAAVVLGTQVSFAAPGDILFMDDFDGGTSAANYTFVVDPDDPAGDPVPAGPGASDVFDAAFAYTDLGIVGDVRSGTGAQFKSENAATAFVSGLPIDGSVDIKISYDLYADPNSSGSTEYAFVGVGSGQLPFQNYLTGALNGQEQSDGVFAGGLTDSDTAGAGDYVILEGDGSVAEPTELFNADAAATAQDGTAFSLILPGGDAGPSGEGTVPAVLQHQWINVELLIEGSQVTYLFDGQAVASVTASGPVTGLVGFGIGDPFPSTNQGLRIPARPDTNIIIDNITITQLPEPTAAALLGVAALGLVAGRRR
ncbi:MAG: hypothetical protein AAF266_09345 [Planctomycetota bacterium]